MQPSPVTVVVVSYNTRDKLRRCLSCIEREHEVIVVDNASRDGSPEMIEAEFPHVRLIRNTDNRGFGAANNQGMDAMSRELVLFLNSDCYARPGAIALLARALEDRRPRRAHRSPAAAHHGVVAVGGRLVNPDGTLQESCANELTLWAVFCEQSYLEKLFPRSRLFSPYWMSARLPKGGEVAQVMGACLMMWPLERFDEGFFLYCEDTDLCRRLSEHGPIMYVPEAEFVHELGSSSSERWQAIWRYNQGKERYFRLHHGPGSSLACWALNRVGALLRLLVWLFATLATLGLIGTVRRRFVTFARVLFK